MPPMADSLYIRDKLASWALIPTSRLLLGTILLFSLCDLLILGFGGGGGGGGL